MGPRQLVAMLKSGCENFVRERQKLLETLQSLIGGQPEVGAQRSQVDIREVAGGKVGTDRGSGCIRRPRF